MPTPRIALISCLVFALAAGYFVAGRLLYTIPIGLDESGFLAGEALQSVALWFVPDLNNAASGLVLLLLVVLGIAGVCFVAVRASVRAHVDPARRRFLTGAGSGAGMALGSIVIAGGVAAARGFFGLGYGGRGWKGVADHINADVVKTHPEWKDAWRGSRVRAYRRLGRTDFQVSDIVLGTGPLKGDVGERVAREALDRGVNYVDTSPDYSAEGSEVAVGRAIKGRRDQLFLATKFCTPIGHLPPGTPVAKYMEAVESSLRRLGTDYVDLIHIHSCDEVDRLMDPNVHEAFDRLEQDGKARFLGFSTHTPNLVEVANTGIDSGRFDVMMLAYHYGLWAPMGEIVTRGRKEQDMGVVAMKTLKGAKHHGLEGFREEEDAFSQAALSWVLSNPDVSCAVISFFEPQHVDEYLHASGRLMGARDLAVLEKYERLTTGTHCQAHCGQCLDSCPETLAINDVLRHRMYFEDYGWEKEGMRLYAALDKRASACASCSGPCLGSCPVGIAIPERMRGAHELLTLS